MSAVESIATVVANRLAPHLGPHVAKMSVKSFAMKGCGCTPDELKLGDVPKLLEAMKPMLSVMLGREPGEVVMTEIRKDLGLD